MTEFKVIEERKKGKFEEAMVEHLEQGWEIVNCMHSTKTEKHHGYLVKK